MRNVLRYAFSLALGLMASTAMAEPVKFARYPHASQGKLVFSYHGDIWIANENGSNPVRLTAHIARDTFPRLSPDGKLVAFTSDRFGNADVFVVPATGGEPKQLTFNTVPDTVLNWTPDGKGILVTTSRAVSPWRSPIHVVPVNGGLPTPLPIDGGVQGMIKQDGSTLAFNRMGGSYWRKGYRGNRSDDVWIQDLKTQRITRLTDTNVKDYKNFTQDVYPMWGGDGQIYFSSERSGHFNIWRIAPTGGQPQQVTTHTDDGVQFPSMSPDGSTIAYENDFEIWTLKVGSRTPTRVTIDLAFDPNTNLISFLPAQNRMDGFAIAADGDYAAVDFHGEIFIIPTDPDVGEKRQVTSSSWRQRGGVFSPNGRWMAYRSDESREEEIWLYDRESGAKKKLTTHESLGKSIDGWSPDSTRFAWTAANRLFVTTAESGQTTELGYNIAGGYAVTGWSGDGKWLVFTKRDADQNSEVFLFEVDTRRELNVTQSPWTESQGTITPDGRRVVFISDRNDGVNQLFVVSLARLTEDPNDPLVRERERRAQGNRGRGAGAAGEAGAEARRRRRWRWTRRPESAAGTADDAGHHPDRSAGGGDHDRRPGRAELLPVTGRPDDLLPLARRSRARALLDRDRRPRSAAPRRRRVPGPHPHGRSPARLLHREQRALSARADRAAAPHARELHPERPGGRTRGVGADPERVVAGHEVPVLRREDARQGLERDPREVRADAQVRRRERRRV